ncbi:MAG: hypothetical protein OXO51_15070 [Gemmatimonadota bacterium]|nr:hypothetical protein [Gemmatimonadota bacterium]
MFNYKAITSVLSGVLILLAVLGLQSAIATDLDQNDLELIALEHRVAALEENFEVMRIQVNLLDSLTTLDSEVHVQLKRLTDLNHETIKIVNDHILEHIRRWH